MKKDKKLIEALRTQNIQMLKELKNDGLDLSGINIVKFTKNKSNIELLKFLIKNGIDINAQNKNGFTALMVAVIFGKIDIVKLLMENGANINAKTEEGVTALELAVEEEQIDIVKLLIINGADTNAQDKYGSTPLMTANKKEKIDLVKLLIQNGADVNAKNKDAKTILFLALKTLNKDLIELLIQNGADVNTPIGDGYTILMLVVLGSSKEGLKKITKEKSDLDSEVIKEKMALLSSVKFLKMLIQNGADVNTQDKNGFTALMLAVAIGHSNMVEFLIHNGAKVNTQYKYGATALINAIGHKHADIVKILIKNGADVNAQDEHGLTALMYVVMKSHASMVEFLIKNGADVNAQDKNGVTALMYVKNKDDISIVELLVENIADVNTQNKNGATALMLAVVNEFNSMAEFLVENGADINMQAKNESTALMGAAEVGNIDMMKLLMKKGADVNVKDKEGATAFILAVILEKIDIVKLLIESGIDINTKYEDGITALWAAIEVKNFDIVKLLIESGADVNKKNKERKLDELPFILKILLYFNKSDILELAIKASSYSIVEFLIENKVKVRKRHIYDASENTDTKILDLILQHAEKIKNINVSRLALDIKPEKIKMLIDYDKLDIDTFAIRKYFNNKQVLQTLIESVLDNKNNDRVLEDVYAMAQYDNNENVLNILDKYNVVPLPNNPVMMFALKMQNSFFNKFKPWSERYITKIILPYFMKSKKYDSIPFLKPITFMILIQDDYDVDQISQFISDAPSIINSQDHQGMTALMWACEKNRLDVVKMLLEYSPDIDIQDLNSKTALDYSSGNNEIYQLLREYKKNKNQHYPKKLAKLLTNFRKDTPIKYTTHDWETNFKEEYGNFSGFIEKVKEQWSLIEAELKQYSPKLHKKIYTFLIENNPSTDYSWCSYENINIGWSSLNGLDNWCDKGNDPNDFKLPKEYIVKSKTLTTFGEVIKIFKQEIQIRSENNMLENIFLDIESDEAFDTFTFDTIKLKGKTFYTDVVIFRESLNRIFSEIKKRPEFNHVKIEIVEDEDDAFYELKITQIGSEANISSSKMLESINGGDSSILKSNFTNLCDWSIETSNEDENYRINCLMSVTVPEVEKLSYKPDGFTHIMRFYV